MAQAWEGHSAGGQGPVALWSLTPVGPEWGPLRTWGPGQVLAVQR